MKKSISAIALLFAVLAMAEGLPHANARRKGPHPAHRHMPDRLRRQGATSARRSTARRHVPCRRSTARHVPPATSPVVMHARRSDEETKAPSQPQIANPGSKETTSAAELKSEIDAWVNSPQFAEPTGGGKAGLRSAGLPVKPSLRLGARNDVGTRSRRSM